MNKTPYSEKRPWRDPELTIYDSTGRERSNLSGKSYRRIVKKLKAEKRVRDLLVKENKEENHTNEE